MVKVLDCKWILGALALAVAAPSLRATCVDGKWDPDFTWIKDCTPNSQYDGWFSGGTGTQVHSGETKVTVGSQTRTLSWRLHWFKSNLPGAPATKDSLPLVVGLHPWNESGTIDSWLNIESSLMQYEGAWEDVVFLTFALETGTNAGTWWDGLKVNGVPTTWAMDAIVATVKERLADGCSLLEKAGATALAGKTLDVNRVYLLGASMGGSGTYHIGMRHPELFAAIHAHAGFADYDGGPCGNENFCTVFTNSYIGTVQENLMMSGLDGKPYPARSYSNMSWFAGAHDGASWTASLGKGRRYEPPFVVMTHGKADNSVHISSANRLFEVLKAKKFGHTFLRHTGGHSNENFARLHWLLGFRLDRSYPAFTNNSTDVKEGSEQYNYLNRVGFMPGSIVDETDRYSIRLTGMGTVDVTPRRLRKFAVAPNSGFKWWLDDLSNPGNFATADAQGVLTLPGVAVNTTTTLHIQPTPAGIGKPARKSDRQTPRGAFKGSGKAGVVFPVADQSKQVDGLGKDVTPR